MEVSNRFAALGSLPDDVEESWAQIRTSILSAASSSIKPPRRKNRPWLTDGALDLLDLKRDARLAGDDAEWKRLRGVFKARAKADLESWYSGIASEAEEGIRNNQTRPAFRAVRRLRVGHARERASLQINKLDGSPCNGADETLERWKEHYEASLNFPSAAGCPDLDAAAASATECTSLRVEPPSLDEVELAISKLKCARAAGADDISPELLKYAGPSLAVALHSLFLQVWKSGHVPAGWRDGVIVSIYKGKGSRSTCSSYRPITLLSVPGKVFAQVLLQRIQPLLLSRRRPQQSGFTPSRSTMDAVLALRLLASLHREFDRPLNVAYVDIKAAFDSVDRQALWKVIASLGLPEPLFRLVKDLHDGTMASVRSESGMSSPFATSSGVRQGCILAPTLFCSAIDWIMSRCESSFGILVGPTEFDDLDYADDAALLADDPSGWHAILSSFRDSASTLGLHPSWAKTKVQNLAAGPPPLPVHMDGELVNSVDSFIYLGCEVNSSGYFALGMCAGESELPVP